MIRTCLFVAGVACFLLFLFLPKHPEYLNQFGWTGFVSAYFLWLAQSYRTKATMYTRGGLLDYTKQPFLFSSVYLFLLLLGIFTVVALLAINLGPYVVLRP